MKFISWFLIFSFGITQIVGCGTQGQPNRRVGGESSSSKKLGSGDSATPPPVASQTLEDSVESLLGQSSSPLENAVEGLYDTAKDPASTARAVGNVMNEIGNIANSPAFDNPILSDGMIRMLQAIAREGQKITPNSSKKEVQDLLNKILLILMMGLKDTDQKVNPPAAAPMPQTPTDSGGDDDSSS